MLNQKMLLEMPRAATRQIQTMLISPDDKSRFEAIARKTGKTRHAILRRMLNNLFSEHSDIVAAPMGEIERMISL